MTELIALVGASAATVAGVTQALKVIAFPAAWQTGRAPMVAAALLSLLAVIAGMLQLNLSIADAAVWPTAATAWLTVYSAAVGVHQTVSKAGRIIAGTTNRAGPDDAAG